LNSHQSVGLYRPKALKQPPVSRLYKSKALEQPSVSRLYRPKALDVEVYKPKALDVEVYKPKALDVEVYRPKALDVEVYKPKALDVEVYKPKALDVEGVVVFGYKHAVISRHLVHGGHLLLEGLTLDEVDVEVLLKPSVSLGNQSTEINIDKYTLECY